MAIDRRSMLCGSLAVLALPRGLGGASAHAGPAEHVYVSAARLGGKSFGVVILSETGEILREIPLRERCHDIALDPVSRRGVVFARRPGFFALAFDVDGLREPQALAPAPDRHFYGHGVFARDGRLLCATEHDVTSGEGVIGIYDATSRWRRVGEFPSYGVGPHEAIVLADGKTLAVANGGFGNDPETGRESVGVGLMEPNISFIDLRTGALQTRHAMPSEVSLLSLRHLVEAPGGDIWFGGQWQGALEESPALIGRVGRDKPARLLDAGEELGVGLKGYIGAVALSADGRFLAATAPRADRVIYADIETGKVVREIVIDDSSGIVAAGASEFAMSTGKGVLRIAGGAGAEPEMLRFAGMEFDNHLRRV